MKINGYECDFAVYHNFKKLSKGQTRRFMDKISKIHYHQPTETHECEEMTIRNKRIMKRSATLDYKYDGEEILTGYIYIDDIDADTIDKLASFFIKKFYPKNNKIDINMIKNDIMDTLILDIKYGMYITDAHTDYVQLILYIRRYFKNPAHVDYDPPNVLVHIKKDNKTFVKMKLKYAT